MDHQNRCGGYLEEEDSDARKRAQYQRELAERQAQYDREQREIAEERLERARRFSQSWTATANTIGKIICWTGLAAAAYVLKAFGQALVRWLVP